MCIRDRAVGARLEEDRVAVGAELRALRDLQRGDVVDVGLDRVLRHARVEDADVGAEERTARIGADGHYGGRGARRGTNYGGRDEERRSERGDQSAAAAADPSAPFALDNGPDIAASYLLFGDCAMTLSKTFPV